MIEAKLIPGDIVPPPPKGVQLTLTLEAAQIIVDHVHHCVGGDRANSPRKVWYEIARALAGAGVRPRPARDAGFDPAQRNEVYYK